MPDTSVHNHIGTPFIELQSVDSTNNYARTLVQEGLAQHGTAVFSHEQWAGKGQRGRSWTTEKSANIILSLLVNPGPLRTSEQFTLSACIAVAVCDFFNKYAGNDARIKWPNDLYWKERKSGGILIENIVGSTYSDTGGQQNSANRAEWKWAIVGIGININQANFPQDLPNPVSLRQITGNKFDIIELAKELCMVIEINYNLLLKNESSLVFQKYNELLYKKGETVKLKKDSRVFDAVISRVTESGKLIIQHSIEEELDFGEVEWLIN